MYQEHKCVKYICKCVGSQTSHGNVSKKKECICNLKDQLNLTDVHMFDPIVHMVIYHKKNQIQPFSVIYLNNNNDREKGEKGEKVLPTIRSIDLNDNDREKGEKGEKGEKVSRTISSIVSNMWKNKDSFIEY